MDKLTIGDAILSRIEETADTSFTAEGFFPAFDLEQSPIRRNAFNDSALSMVEAVNGAGFTPPWLGAGW